jgi:hypothetical protein
MNPDDETYSSTGEVLNDVVDEVMRGPEPNDPAEPRDPLWLRSLKFAAIVFVLAFIFGLFAVSFDYLSQYRESQADERMSAHLTQKDVTHELRNWFLTGAGIGGGLGLIYVVQCIFRKVDP